MVPDKRAAGIASEYVDHLHALEDELRPKAVTPELERNNFV